MITQGNKNLPVLQRPAPVTVRSIRAIPQAHSTHRDPPDVEMEEANEITPRQRNFLPNPEDLPVEPYETPVALKNKKRQVIELSDAESDTSETMQIERDRKESGKEGVTKVCCVVMRLNWLCVM